MHLLCLSVTVSSCSSRLTLGFVGHGRLSCPGRFFAVQEIKLLMAYMLLNYDIKYLPSKPKQKWLGPMSMPDMSATITVRRKSETVKA